MAYNKKTPRRIRRRGLGGCLVYQTCTLSRSCANEEYEYEHHEDGRALRFEGWRESEDHESILTAAFLHCQPISGVFYNLDL